MISLNVGNSECESLDAYNSTQVDSCSSMTSVHDTPSSITCMSVLSQTVIDNQTMIACPGSCAMWSCPLVENEAQQQCAICLQKVSRSVLLSCLQCKQSGCVTCHLRNLSARQFRDRRDAHEQQVSCFFCREPYKQIQLHQLEVIYRAHSAIFPFFLWKRQDTPIPNVNSAVNVIRSALSQNETLNLMLSMDLNINFITARANWKSWVTCGAALVCLIYTMVMIYYGSTDYRLGLVMGLVTMFVILYYNNFSLDLRLEHSAQNSADNSEIVSENPVSDTQQITDDLFATDSDADYHSITDA